MAKVVGPLLSVDARGKVADAMVFSYWRGQKYVRQWVKPSNPNTASQQAQRTRMKEAMEAWVKDVGATQQQGWRDYQAGQSISGPNQFVKQHIAADKAADTIDPPTSVVVTPGADQLTVTWTTTDSHQGEVLIGDKHRVYSGSFLDGAPTTSHSVVCTGLVTGVTYYVYPRAEVTAGVFAEAGEYTGVPT